jgi:hypothetical protein
MRCCRNGGRRASTTTHHQHPFIKITTLHFFPTILRSFLAEVCRILRWGGCSAGSFPWLRSRYSTLVSIHNSTLHEGFLLTLLQSPKNGPPAFTIPIQKLFENSESHFKDLGWTLACCGNGVRRLTVVLEDAETLAVCQIRTRAYAAVALWVVTKVPCQVFLVMLFLILSISSELTKHIYAYSLRLECWSRQKPDSCWSSYGRSLVSGMVWPNVLCKKGCGTSLGTWTSGRDM